MEPQNRIQTIEQTGKKWKLTILIGAVIFSLGACVWFLILAQGKGALNVGAWISLSGIAVYSIGRIGAWWQHG